MTLRYNLMIGSHAATAAITTGDGPFTGVIESQEFGTGSISGTITGGKLEGEVELGGHSATVTANLADSKITGKLRAGWFFSLDITGALAA